MSRTQQANGHRVELAVQTVMYDNPGWKRYVTAGEVAKVAKVSKPTARKYLTILVAHGTLEAYNYQGQKTICFIYAPQQEVLVW